MYFCVDMTGPISSGFTIHLLMPAAVKKVSVQCPLYATVFEGCIPFHMVAELGRSTSNIRTRANLLGRAASAGSIQLGGSARSTEQTSRDRFTTLGINKALGIGFWTLIFLTCAVGSLFLWEMAAADGSPTQQPNDIQQLGVMLQQMMNEQQRQRDWIEELGQAVQGTAGAIQGTQATTEQVIQQVVAQVQAGFQQEQHQHQEQLAQVSQAVQAIQVQVQQIPVTAADQLQQIGQAVQAMQGQIQQQVSPEQVQQIGQAVQSLQGQVQQIGSAAAAGGIGMNAPPPAPAGSPHGSPPAHSGPPPVFQFGSGATPGGFGFGATAGPSISPAVAYAIQQGGVDGRQLGKPSTFNPTDSKVSFQDWSGLIR